MSIKNCAALFVATAAVAACGGEQHLTKHYGESYNAAFAVQRTRTNSPPANVASGLDSQEAAIVSEAYRASLAPKGTKVEEQPVILVAPPTRDRPQALAPSVPK